jgi:hypothetical protein
LAVLGGDAGTAVVDCDHHAPLAAFDAHRDLGSDRCVAHGVCDQVVDDPLDLERIDRGIGELGAERDRVPVSPVRRDNSFGEGRNVRLREPRADEAVSQAIEVEEVGE